VIAPQLDSADFRALVGHLEATIVALALAIVVWRVALAVVDRVFARRFISTHLPRVATFSTLSKSVVGLLVLVAGALALLNVWSVDVVPAVWSAGFITAALAFGSQNLVRDIVTGFFFLFEDQYDVGDRVELVTSGGQMVAGRVDAMGLRTTRIIDRQGRFVVVANGNIALVTNASRLPTTAGFALTVPWKGDALAMRQTVEAHARAIAADAGLADAQIRVSLVETTADNATFRIEMRTSDAEADLDRSDMRERIAAMLQREGWLPGGAEAG